MTVPSIPLEDFFRNPEKARFTLSPDGSLLGYMKPWKHRMNVFVRPLDGGDEVRVTSEEDRGVAGYFWASNGRIAYLKDTGGDENFRLYTVRPDGSDHICLTPFDKVRVQVIDDLEDNDDEMIIGLNKRDPQVFDAYRINVHTGGMSMIAENPGNIETWVTDNAGRLRAATVSDGVNAGLLYRETEDDEFRTVLTTNFKESLNPLFFTFDDTEIYASSNLGRDKAVLVRYDIANGKEKEVVFMHPDVDVSALLRSKKRKKITGAAFTTDKRQYYFFDNTRQRLQEYLEGELPGYQVDVASMSRDETRVLVRAYSDRSLGAYYFHDLETKEFRKLDDVSPWINEDHMAPMEPVSYRSRDGLTIHGYLTLPKDSDGKNLPVVVNPHGGPWHRDTWGYNPEVQFLANRGYAVLQMNFRGSTGYGRAFWEASFRQWGRAMQDDITDGVNWLVGKGIAAPGRIGIYGGSYGGYAVLAGLAFTPDLYACGVDYVGVSNLLTFMNTIPPYWEPFRKMMYEMVGDPDTEEAFLKEWSPYFNADRITAPLFIAQGANDPRVNKAESDQIVDALKERGIDVPYMVKNDEGHGFHNEENRFDFYRAMERFLEKHLKK